MSRIVILLLLLLPSLAWANGSGSRSHPRKPVKVEKDCSAWGRIQEGFALTAGFRWDKECPECPPVACDSKSVGNHDPFFVGAELRLPLTSRLSVAGNYDRDWTEGPDWNARVHLSYKPFK